MKTIYFTHPLHWIMLAFPILMISAFTFQLSTQTIYEIGNASTLTISGTSTLHDWTIIAAQIQGKGTIELQDNKILNFRDLQVKVPVERLKSGKGSMDKNTYTALNAEQHPFITYTFTKVNRQEGHTLFTSGVLEVAGISKPIDLQVNYTLHSPQKIQIKGESSFNMSDFGVEPPVALLGTIKTGDKVTIAFDVNFLP